MYWGLKLYFQDRYVAVGSVSAALFFVMGIIYGFVYFHPGGEPVFLHYNSVFGVDLVGEWWKILYFPALGFSIGIANFLISLNLFVRERLVARFLVIFTALIQLAILCEFIFIIGLNS